MARSTVLRWTLVRCAAGAPILGLVDGRRWRGWLVPWLPDASMVAIGAQYFGDAEPERMPSQAQSGEWEYRDDGDEWVTLQRHRRTVAVGARRGTLALNDGADMAWCWDEVPLTDDMRRTLDRLMKEVAAEVTPRKPK
jgi:hypothetical protein